MNREEIKKMSHSLKVYSKVKSLTKMNETELSGMPKEVIIGCAANEIALVWDKLPEHLKEDIDISRYQYCYEHDNGNDSDCIDVNDGPPPRKIFCCFCRVHDINFNTTNKTKDPTRLCCSQQ